MNTRKRKVLDVARSLFIQKGFYETSIIDIIQEAKISKGTFYNYFTSKNECFIAILRESREEASIRRYELAVDQDPRDIEILSKQIAVLMHINREQNLLQIFEAIYHSNDKDLQKAVMKHHLQEIEWLASRLVEVYGEKINELSYECAIQTFAMIHQTLRTLKIAKEHQINPESVIKMALRNIDAIIPRMLETKEVIINIETIQRIKNSVEQIVLSKDTVMHQLSGFIEILKDEDPKDGKEFAHYILHELQSEPTKVYILKALLTPFRKAFSNTTHAAESREIANHIWRLLEIYAQHSEE
ncbi:TetR/AcrR family transcriptional regulator [Rummeliibacillus sp. POC4]|uniref:TetR/AcrR family transcriptional regulator n=1 Tax=Rummeliibacillus sp. POC4 TaxID=2305899 RepID=UPI000E667F93|nr:TetR/AcrR family transcriptional regulator [Rummeliibacillus sp. POC4]RIJ67966.1 TetR/AcrR family transcriptional regulator [Rummeliibacillus sp. POC4]